MVKPVKFKHDVNLSLTDLAPSLLLHGPAAVEAYLAGAAGPGHAVFEAVAVPRPRARVLPVHRPISTQDRSTLSTMRAGAPAGKPVAPTRRLTGSARANILHSFTVRKEGESGGGIHALSFRGSLSVVFSKVGQLVDREEEEEQRKRRAPSSPEGEEEK